MSKADNEKEDNPKKDLIYTSSILHDGILYEMLYEPGKRTIFAFLNQGEASYIEKILIGGKTVLPYPIGNSVLTTGLVRFPSEAVPYTDEKQLLQEVQEFIHHFLDVSPYFERLAAHYVLLTWVYDSFSEVPYLRAVADFGRGKSRFLDTIGSLCYKPIFATGAIGPSPIFRLLDSFHGTLILDEADFSLSDEKAEIIKVLNSGNAKGRPVIRSEQTKQGQYTPVAFDIFGPKIVATRGYFQDKALESRFIVEELGTKKMRTDIPISLPSWFQDDALKLRNQLLSFRLHNYGKLTIREELADRTLEPRLNQVILPLLSIIDDVVLAEQLKSAAKEYFEQNVTERGLSYDGQILEVVAELLKLEEVPTIQRIREYFLQRFGDDYDERKVTARGIGARLRNAFRVHTKRGKGGYYHIPPDQYPKLYQAFVRYGIDFESAGVGKSPVITYEDVLEVFPEAGEPSPPSQPSLDLGEEGE